MINNLFMAVRLRKPRKLLFTVILISVVIFTAGAQEIKIVVAATSDVHGSLFPWNFEEGKPAAGSLAGVYQLTDSIRHSGTELILLENGDLLQGTPVAYYANFIQKKRKNLFSRALNLMKYDASTVGNHDIEAGPAIYYRMQKELKAPYLAANILNETTREPAFKPYVILKRKGISVAVLGMITPSVPEWLPLRLWKDLIFDDMVPQASKWVQIIRETEDPDLIVGLFHSGFGNLETGSGGKALENAGQTIAATVPGFDLIITGHDHLRRNEWVTRGDSSRVLVLNPGNGAAWLATAEFTLSRNKKEKPRLLKTEGHLLKVPAVTANNRFTRRFRKDQQEITKFSTQKVGVLTASMQQSDALFGNSTFLDLIHKVQLEITGADISLAAPLSISGSIPAGELLVRDLFKIYRFENFLYTMELTGEEVRKHLEFSYGIWLNTMHSPDDHLLLFREESDRPPRLANPYYNFDSAAGILYTVDITRPPGERVAISRFENGTPFDPSKTYRVAVNSYRGSGGGGHLTTGAGIPREELADRIVMTSDTDMRTILMNFIKSQKVITPEAGTNWKIIPEEYSATGVARDKQLIANP